MNFKVGQWVRVDNEILQIKKIEDNVAYGYDRYGYFIPVIEKIANTPQELVQDKDLVEIESKIEEVNDYKNWSKKEKNNITKILTPNSNGGYDLQYNKGEIE